MSAPAPSCRSRPTTRPTTRCMPRAGTISADDCRSGQRRAGAGRPHRRGRHDLAAAARKRCRRGRHGLRHGRGATDIFITPGYRFRIVDALMTNFHLPRSTLFMLVSAFSGLETMRAAYAPCDRAAATGSIPTATPACCCRATIGCTEQTFSASACSATDGKRAARRDLDAARHDPHAGLHAGRHRRHGQGDVYGPGARRSAPTSSSATPII